MDSLNPVEVRPLRRPCQSSKFTILDDFSSPLSLSKRGGGRARNSARFPAAKSKRRKICP
jgi:hypothetical protein